jgi:hypothetical protein
MAFMVLLLMHQAADFYPIQKNKALAVVSLGVLLGRGRVAR